MLQSLLSLFLFVPGWCQTSDRRFFTYSRSALIACLAVCEMFHMFSVIFLNTERKALCPTGNLISTEVIFCWTLLEFMALIANHAAYKRLTMYWFLKHGTNLHLPLVPKTATFSLGKLTRDGIFVLRKLQVIISFVFLFIL